MPEWFKGDDLRSSGASLVGSNPTSSIKGLNIVQYKWVRTNPVQLKKSGGPRNNFRRI